MSGESTLPGAADKLIQIIRGAVGGDLTTDGQGITDSEATEVIQIGYVDTDDDNFAEGTTTTPGLGPQDLEQYDIHCAIIVVNGDGDAGDPSAARVRAFALLAIIRQLLVAIRPPDFLPGVAKIGVGNWAYRPDKIESGARALLRFDIGVEAFTKP